ncbi:MAG: hypothetical protein P4L53_11085 [Candidatus Obscuribacterales bacterium]|nr:hypothetical protein [Candidatus Obscuribacterales bacterium]
MAHFDPEQLVVSGAPKNEYAGEAEEIARTVAMWESCDDIEQALVEVFHKNFDYAYVLADKLDGIAFTKHAIGKINFSATPGRFVLRSQNESLEQRAPRLRDAASAIFQVLKSQEAP